MKTVEYKLKGTRRKVGAIGIMTRFTVIVSRQTGTMTALDAMNTARESMYYDGYEHILFTSCLIKKNNAWVEIPMMQALELE